MRWPSAFPAREIVQQVIAQLPWGHAITLVEAIKAPHQRIWYAEQARINGWSRNVLSHQISSDLFVRQGKAITNFSRTLPAPQSDLAQALMKDPYCFEFLGLGADISERELERGLLDHLRLLFLELAKGLPSSGPNIISRWPGRMNFYLSAVDDLLRHADDAPTIGIILCQGKNAVVVEYALRASVKPMGVAEYRLSEGLPLPLQAVLPTAKELAREFP